MDVTLMGLCSVTVNQRLFLRTQHIYPTPHCVALFLSNWIWKSYGLCVSRKSMHGMHDEVVALSLNGIRILASALCY